MVNFIGFMNVILRNDEHMLKNLGKFSNFLMIDDHYWNFGTRNHYNFP